MSMQDPKTCLNELLKVVSQEVFETFVASLFKNNPHYLTELFVAEILWKNLGIIPEKCSEPIADLCWKDLLLVEVKRAGAISDNEIYNILAHDESNKNQLVKYLALSEAYGKTVVYVFICSLNEYRIVKLSDIIKLIEERSPSLASEIRELAKKKIQILKEKDANKSKKAEEADPSIIESVINLYKKGFSIREISRLLKLSEYRVRKILVERKVDKAFENLCPRCLHRMVDYVLYYYCPHCGYKRDKNSRTS